MNSFQGHIASLVVEGSLTFIKAAVGEVQFSALVIDTPATADYLQEGHPVEVVFKETEVIICTGDTGKISLQNRLPGTVKHIESGKALSRLTLDTVCGPVVSVITTNAVNQLALQPGSKVTAMIKTNEIMIVIRN